MAQPHTQTRNTSNNGHSSGSSTGERTPRSPTTGVFTGARGSDSSDTRLAPEDSSVVSAPAVMEDIPQECKSDSTDAERQQLIFEAKLPRDSEEAPLTDVCSTAGVDDSVVMGTVNPPSACQPLVEDVPVATSPRSPRNFKNLHARRFCSSNSRSSAAGGITEPDGSTQQLATGFLDVLLYSFGSGGIH